MLGEGEGTGRKGRSSSQKARMRRWGRRDVSVEGVREGVEDIGCKPQKEIMGIVTPSRIVRRGGRVSNIIKTLEEGAKQQNKQFHTFLNLV